MISTDCILIVIVFYYDRVYVSIQVSFAVSNITLFAAKSRLCKVEDWRK
jgi:hypothetical protein